MKKLKTSSVMLSAALMFCSTGCTKAGSDAAAGTGISSVHTTQGTAVSTTASSSATTATEITTTTELPAPINLRVTQIALGNRHSAAITEDGNLYMWGCSSFGALGISGNSDPTLPAQVKLPGKVKIVSLGYFFSGAVLEDGSLYMWGANDVGELGTGDTRDRSTPEKVDLPEPVIAFSAGGDTSAAMTESGKVYTWGNNHWGQLGNYNSGGDISRYDDDCDSNVPVMIEFPSPVTAIALGGNHCSALSGKGELYLWGYNNEDQIGPFPRVQDHPRVLDLSEKVEKVTLGCFHSAALTTGGHLFLWGKNTDGELGNGKPSVRESQHVEAILPERIIDVKLGCGHSAALTETGKVYTWGRNDSGQLGNGLSGGKSGKYDEGIDSSVPSLIELPQPATAIALGSYFSGAILEDGSLYMWGDNDEGQLGDGTTEDRSAPVKITITAEP